MASARPAAPRSVRWAGHHVGGLVGPAPGEVFLELLVGPHLRVLLAPEFAIELSIVPLPLPRRVIHHAEQAQRRIVDMALDDPQQCRIR